MLKVATFLFWGLFVHSDSAFRYSIFVALTSCSNVVNSTVGKQTKKCEIVIYEYMITTTIWVIGNHRLVDFFSSLKENFKNLLFNSLITEWSFENCSYLSSCWCHNNGDFEEYFQKWHWIRHGFYKSVGGRLPIYFTVGKLIAPTKQ